jgi:hypothetical protein
LEKYTTSVFKIDDGVYGVRPGVFGATAVLKIFPDSRPVFVSTYYNTVIYTNDIDSIDIVNEWDTKPFGEFVAIDILQGKPTRIPLIIKGYDKSFIGSEVMSVKDFNNDGYDDIIQQQWNKFSLPTIYINNRDGTFSLFDPNIEKFEYQFESIVDDFNNDGLPDSISHITYWQQHLLTNDMSTFKYYASSGGFSSFADLG